MIQKAKFLVVSNRLPVSVSKVDGKLQYNVSSGGLATAMSSLDAEDSRIWVGWPGIAADDITATEKAQITKELKKHGCYPVFLTKAQIENFYEGYSNDTLWPLFHYFQSFATYAEKYWNAYKQVNKLYLSAVSRLASPNARIWIHDYHLMLLPALTRKKLPDASIGFFLHIPFPSYEIYRLLPERKEILEGLLGSDLIGFHIYDYARHFASSVLRIFGVHSHHGTLQYGTRTIKIDAFPIGIDYKKFRTTLQEEAVKQERQALEQHYKDQKIILSVDRLDYSKGILQRLEAFELLLKEKPQYHKKIAMVIIAVPSRTEVETYRSLRDTIEQTVSRINGLYGSVDWAPISYQFQNLPFEKIVALYSEADVALVTPIRDGMNLIAKEYVASQTTKAGVLILSEMAGAIDELPESLSINPNDSRSIVRAMTRALSMSKSERLRRLKSMQRRISRYTVQRWGNDFIAELKYASDSMSQTRQKKLSSAVMAQIRDSYKSAKQKLILLDYDGTLQSFKPTPRRQDSKPSRSLKNLLKKLADAPNTKLCIVSGRKRTDLEDWFSDLDVLLVAEHGAWLKYNKSWTQIETTFNKDKKALLPILEKYTNRTVGSEIEEKDFALVWHYRKVPTELAYVRAANLKRELQAVVGGSDVGVFSGNKIIEVKLKDVHKGYAAAELMALFPSDFILCIGDDYTDEDMFRQLPEEAFTIKVGGGETNARYQLASVEKVINFLKTLTG